MAHRGKNYRLAFRRDFNLNVRTYMGGLADAYFITLAHFAYADHPALRDTSWLCGPSTNPDNLTLEWLSDYRLLGGLRWRVRMFGTLTGGPAIKFWPRAELQQFDANNVLRWQMSDPVHFSSMADSDGAKVLSWDPVVFPSGPGSAAHTSTNPVPYT